MVRITFSRSRASPGGVTRKFFGIKFVGESRREIGMVVGGVELSGLDTEHWHRFQLSPDSLYI
ncbi:hypothetical protein K488DRAFT_87358 [Vararia minispora EC-137]|uniref:Uncharacterized protein n=1 Tax=Vararia minispora EC-137 TaxID=1314806 RepID=A0ACB8QGN0_9AGAM|nr:hypothetical protein K488DRAFT_87358 [Vararia minispora EC-137]